MTSVRRSLLLLAAMTLAMPARAGEAEEPAPDDWVPGEFSGNVTLISDYVFRGVSQTRESFALQAGIDWSHETGIYAGTWGSSVSFGDASFLEQDFYVGFANEFAGFSYDLAAIFFYYPKENDFNYWEFAFNTGYDFGAAAVSAGVLWSPDYFGTLDSGWYFSTGVNVPIPVDIPYGFDLAVDATAGFTTVNEDIFGTDEEYWDWSVGLQVGMPKGFSLDLRYHDTDVDDVGSSVEDLADERFVAGLTFSF